MIYAVGSDIGLCQRIMADIGLSVEINMCGWYMGLLADRKCRPWIL